MTRAAEACLAVCFFAQCALGQAAPGPQTRTQTQDSAAPAVPVPQPDNAQPSDRHNGVTVSAKPCIDPEIAKEKFGKANPLPLGILPVEVFLHNETNSPLRIDLSTVRLSVRAGGHSQDIQWLTVREVATAVAHPHGPAAPHQPRLPSIGVPTGADTKADKLVVILQPLLLDADVLPPQSMLHGFLFFDLNRDLSLAEDASLYVPNVSSIPGNKPLMFFEVPLSTSAPAKP